MSSERCPHGCETTARLLNPMLDTFLTYLPGRSARESIS